MNLYQITIDNNLDYEEHEWKVKLIVVKDEKEAEKRAEDWMNGEYIMDSNNPYFILEHIKEIDGYEISVTRKNNFFIPHHES